MPQVHVSLSDDEVHEGALDDCLACMYKELAFARERAAFARGEVDRIGRLRALGLTKRSGAAWAAIAERCDAKAEEIAAEIKAREAKP